MKKFTHTGVLFVILALLVTGCFQQAGEAFQPASSTEAPIDFTDNPLPTADDSAIIDVQATDAPALTSFPATPTLPGIDMTIISPTRVLGVSATPAVAEPTAEDGLPTVEGQTFRTPVSPLGPVTPDTPVPVVPSGAGSATPSGLITPTALPGIGSDPGANGDCAYTIQRGETLFRIAIANDTTVNDIVAANPGINPNLIQPGQVIQLPGCTPGGQPDVVAPVSPPDTGVSPPSVGGTTYTVQRGDTLFGIAQRFGVTVQAIVNANNLTNPDNLSVGQQLVIPAAP